MADEFSPTEPIDILRLYMTRYMESIVDMRKRGIPSALALAERYEKSVTLLGMAIEILERELPVGPKISEK